MFCQIHLIFEIRQQHIDFGLAEMLLGRAEHLAEMAFAFEARHEPDVTSGPEAFDQQLTLGIVEGEEWYADPPALGNSLGHFRAMLIAHIVDLEDHKFFLKYGLMFIQPAIEQVAWDRSNAG